MLIPELNLKHFIIHLLLNRIVLICIPLYRSVSDTYWQFYRAPVMLMQSSPVLKHQTQVSNCLTTELHV